MVDGLLRHGLAPALTLFLFGTPATATHTADDVQAVEVRGARQGAAFADEADRPWRFPDSRTVTSIRPDDRPMTPPLRLEDLAASVPGLLVEPANAGLSSAVKLRGFAVSRLHRDGLPDVQRMFVRDMATVERVDVLQGPVGALVGVSSPGGMVQFVGKRPQALADTTLQLLAGTQAFGRLVLDSTGPLHGAGADLRYRLIGVAQDGRTAEARLPVRHQQGLAALEWHYGNGWIGIDWQVQHNQTPFNFGTVITNAGALGRATQAADVAWDRLLVVPGGMPADRRYHDGRLQWQHTWAGGLQANLSLGQATVTRDETLLGYWAVTSPSSLSSYWTRYNDTYRQRAARVDLQGRLAHGDWQHALRIGADRYRQGFLFDGLQNVGAFSIDLAAPQAAAWATPPLPVSRRYNDERIDERGVWIADQATWRDKFEITVMARHQAYGIESSRVPVPRKAVGAATATPWLVGMSWRLSPVWRVFGSAATGMDANRGTQADGGFLAPQTSLQTEAGFALQQDRFRASTSLWRVDLNHLAMPDPLDRTALVAAGGRRVQGLHAQWSYEGDTWGFNGHLSMQRTRQLTRTSNSLGDRFVGVPDGQSALQAWWRLPTEHAAMPITLMVGLTGMDSRMADVANTVLASGYARLDLALRLSSLGQKEVWTLQVRNVADRRYVEAVTRPDDVFQGSRRQAWLGWQGRW